MLKAPPSYLRVASALSIALLIFPSALSQSKEKPKLNDFGSSLKRLKWDPNQNAVFETKPNSKARTKATGDDVVRVETSLVVSDVLVVDAHGQAIQGLTAKDFSVTEDGETQQVAMFSPGDNTTLPRSIVLIMDYSCMQLPFLQTSVTAAKTLVAKLGPTDRMAIVTDDIELLVNFTNNKGRLKDGLDSLIKRTGVSGWHALPEFDQRPVPFGRGFQFSALMAVLREAFDDEDLRPIVVFQTQGTEAHILQNPILMPPIPTGLSAGMKSEMERAQKHHQGYMRRNKREFSLNDVYRTAETSRATIYTVVPGFRLIGLSVDEQITQMRAWNDRVISLPLMTQRARKETLNLPRDILQWEAEDTVTLQSALAVLSTITGGWIEFLNQTSQAPEIYSRIVSDMSQRYLVGYYSTNKMHDGKRRKISITIRHHPDYVVMGRKAYYAPTADE